MIAESASEWGSYFQNGVSVAVLIWFMFRCEIRQKAGEEATDRLTRAVLLLVVTHPSPSVPKAAEAILKEVEVAEGKRKQ